MPGVLGHPFSDSLYRHLDNRESHFGLSEHSHLGWPLAQLSVGRTLGLCVPRPRPRIQAGHSPLPGPRPYRLALQHPGGPACPAPHCDPAPLRLEPPTTCVSEESPSPAPMWTPAAGQPPLIHGGWGSVPSAAERGPAVRSSLGDVPRSPLSPRPQAPCSYSMVHETPYPDPASERALPETSTPRPSLWGGFPPPPPGAGQGCALGAVPRPTARIEVKASGKRHRCFLLSVLTVSRPPSEC